ncbi:MAG: acyl-CoA dehydrogenase [Myxococcota bacterium]
MSSLHHYRSNLRDTFFNLFEVLRIQDRALGKGPYANLDEATVRDLLEQAERFASTTVAESFADADREGLRFDNKTGDVTLPASLRKSLAAYYEAGMNKLEVPERLGGFGAPPSVVWSSFEMMAGANASLVFYPLGTFIACTIDRLGTPSQKKRYVQQMLDKSWGGTMVLTEPDAGSDVGAARTKARHIKDDVWEIEGTKRFITNGDFDLPENIVHLVLARPEGAGPGTKGLSMFIVPKFWVEEDGSMGPRNGVFATNVEKKMGIKASATCEMTFGDKFPARGLLVGEVHDGIRQMFHVIEHARMAVGVKSMSTLSTAYLNALSYTKERKQGAELARAADKTAPRVEIIKHPDVRRMLMLQKSHAEGLRALALYTAEIQDQIRILEAAGTHDERMDALEKKNDLLLPIVKGYSSDRVYELLSVSLQCFGGSGFCQDYPIEQYIRDQKIDTLYEGTTHIQALDLIFRKILKDGGQTLRALLGELAGHAKQAKNVALLAPDADSYLRALQDMEGLFGVMTAKMQEAVDHVGIWANKVLFSLAEVVIGGLLLRQGLVAAEKLSAASGSEEAFYRGKLAALRFFCEQVLPNVTLAKKLVEKGSLELVKMDESWF